MAQYEADVDWPRAFWIGFGVVLGTALLFVLYSFIGTFVFGVFLYYATRPLYRRVYRVVRQRTLAAFLSLGLLALPVLVLLYYTIAIAIQEFGKFSEQTDLGFYSEMIEPYLDISTVVTNPQTLLTEADRSATLVDTLTQLADYVGFVSTGLVHLFVMFAVAFYLLRDGPRFAEWGKDLLDHRGVLDRYFHEVDASFDRVFYGTILHAIISGAIGAIAFSVVDAVAPLGLSVPYPALTGLLAGVASLVPVIGMKIVYVPISAYLAVRAAIIGDGWWFVGLFVGVAFLIVDTIPDLLVRPYVSSGGSLSLGRFGRAAESTDRPPGIHTGTLMFAYIFGPFLFGWYGLFLAPMLLVLIVHFARIVLPELLLGRRIEPQAVDPTNLVGEEPPAGNAERPASPPTAAEAPERSGSDRSTDDGPPPDTSVSK